MILRTFQKVFKCHERSGRVPFYPATDDNVPLKTHIHSECRDDIIY